MAATTGLLLLHYLQVQQLKHASFESLVGGMQQQARTQLKRLFDPVNGNLSIVGRWVEAESPALNDTAALNSRLMPILLEVPQISSALLADSDGREYMLMRTAEGWLTRLRDPRSPGGSVKWQRWTDLKQAQESWEETIDYDPRTRPWFRGAVDSTQHHGVFWTPPYRFFTTEEPGITAAGRWPISGQGDKFMVVAFDVLLADISALTIGSGAGNSGKVFILTGDGRVAGVPDDPQFDTPASINASVLTAADAFPVPLVREAYASWLADGRPLGEPFVFEIHQELWWASFWNYTLGNESLWLAVADPETDLVQRIGGPQYDIAATILTIGVLVSLASFAAMRRHRQGLVTGKANDTLDAALAHLGDNDTDLPRQTLALIDSGENERLEFKSSVRWNFKAGRPGKEMELAWLKTVVAYLNSLGGVILLGVDDSGQVLGLDKDGFDNDDKALRHIENLIARHIGSAYFPYVRSRLITVHNKRVLMIICDAAPAPVFLKHDKGEDFYIRTGPASRSLTPSEVLTYVDSRKLR